MGASERAREGLGRIFGAEEEVKRKAVALEKARDEQTFAKAEYQKAVEHLSAVIDEVRNGQARLPFRDAEAEDEAEEPAGIPAVPGTPIPAEERERVNPSGRARKKKRQPAHVAARP